VRELPGVTDTETFVYLDLAKQVFDIGAASSYQVPAA
jgi:hypothetical protein